MTRLACMAGLSLAVAAGGAQAQLLPGLPFDSRQFRIEQLGENHVRLIGEVEIDEEDYQFFADQVDVHLDESRLVAVGNVVYVGDGGRVAGDRAEFHTEDLTATFYNASGSVTLAEEDVDRSMFGTQEPDMLFYGDMVEKLGPRTYRLTRGGFTSCVQPTPRWEMTASTLTINLESHALLRNSVLKVKGVPVLYLPAMYYPIPDDNRATGFLMPTYGSSTLRGQGLSNAFFWAMGRSHDLTLYHDWFPRSGQGQGAEYRYALGRGSRGNLQAYFLGENEATQLVGGREVLFPERRSYDVRGSVRHRISQSLSARAQINYFSDVIVQQQYQANVFDASSRERTMSANVAGSWGLYQLSGTFDLNETFFGSRESTVWGAGPRVTFGQSQRTIPGTPIYFSFGSEYARLLRTSTILRDPFAGPAGEVEVDSGLDRFDVNPVIQIPFTRWRFLTIDSSVSWQGTHWTESLAGNGSRAQVAEGVTRSLFDLRSRITGPSFVKVWDTPGGGYAERMKHVIEPWVTLQRTTAVDDFDRIVCSITLGPANPIRARGSATCRSASMAKLAVTPPVVGSVSTATYGRRARSRRASAALILAICISDSAPSIIRAPPEQQTITSGSRRSSARSAARVMISPTTTPMLPPMKPYSMATTAASIPSIRPTAESAASRRPVAARPASSRCLYGLLSRNSSGSVDSRPRSNSDHPSSSSEASRCRAVIRKWWEHFPHTRRLLARSFSYRIWLHDGHFTQRPSGTRLGSAGGTSGVRAFLNQFMA